jgi:hypothetical protein
VEKYCFVAEDVAVELVYASDKSMRRLKQGMVVLRGGRKSAVRKLPKELLRLVFELLRPNRVVESGVLFELPDGNLVELGQERFLIPEMLFQPPFLLHCAVAESIAKSCLEDQLCANIVLVGGPSNLKGLSQRLAKEIQLLLPNAEVHLQGPEKDSVWLGGSILASLPTFQSQWIVNPGKS